MKNAWLKITGLLLTAVLLFSLVGCDLDALADCLGELPRNCTVFLFHTEAALQSDYGRRAVEVLREAASDVPFRLICLL